MKHWVDMPAVPSGLYGWLQLQSHFVWVHFVGVVRSVPRCVHRCLGAAAAAAVVVPPRPVGFLGVFGVSMWHTLLR